MKNILLILSLTMVIGVAINATDFGELDEALTSNVLVVPKTGGKNNPFPYLMCSGINNKQCLSLIKKNINTILKIQENDEKLLLKINEKYKKSGYRWSAKKYTKDELIKEGKAEILSNRGVKSKYYSAKIKQNLIKPNEKQLMKACYDKDLRKLFYKTNKYRKYPWIIIKKEYRSNGLKEYKVLHFKNCEFTSEIRNVGSDNNFPYIEKLN